MCVFGFTKNFLCCLPQSEVAHRKRDGKGREASGGHCLNVTLCALIKYNFGTLKWRRERAKPAKSERQSGREREGESSSQLVARKVLKL